MNWLRRIVRTSVVVERVVEPVGIAEGDAVCADAVGRVVVENVVVPVTEEAQRVEDADRIDTESVAEVPADAIVFEGHFHLNCLES